MLGDGVYGTYHTNKGKTYGTDGYVISVMVYAPNTLVVNPGQSIDQATITSAPSHYDALESPQRSYRGELLYEKPRDMRV